MAFARLTTTAPERVDRRPGDCHHQPGVVGLGIRVDEARSEAFSLEVGDVTSQLVDGDPAVPFSRPVKASQQVVQEKPGPKSDRCPSTPSRPGRGVGESDVFVDRNHELERLEQVVGDAGQNFLFPETLRHQLELELRQVSNAAVEQLGRSP